jgi:hypothetical protein
MQFNLTKVAVRRFYGLLSYFLKTKGYRMNLRRTLQAPVLVILSALSLPALADRAGVTFGPFVGGGSCSDGSDVRYVSGFRAQVSKSIAETTLFSVKPVLTVENSFFNTRHESDESVTVTNYDSLNFGAGLTLAGITGERRSQWAPFATVAYSMSQTSLGIAESSTNRFSQADLDDATGRSYSGEMGVIIPLEKNFKVNVSILRSQTMLDLSKATGSSEIEEETPAGLSLRSDDTNTSKLGLSDTLVQKTIAGSLSVSLLF